MTPTIVDSGGFLIWLKSFILSFQSILITTKAQFQLVLKVCDAKKNFSKFKKPKKKSPKSAKEVASLRSPIFCDKTSICIRRNVRSERTADSTKHANKLKEISKQQATTFVGRSGGLKGIWIWPLWMCHESKEKMLWVITGAPVTG